MSRKQAVPTAAARPKSVVMSVRLWPDVAEGYRKLSDETGLSVAALLANGLTLLRSDPSTKELIAACEAFDATFARIMAKKRSRALAKT